MTGKYNNSIKPSGVKKVTPNFAPNSFLDALAIRNYYREMLRDKVLGEDPQLMELVIDHIEEIRQRFSCVINLYARGEQVASLEVFGALIENGQAMVNYWYGLEIDPSNFETQKSSFQNSISKEKVRQVNTLFRPMKAHKVDGVSVTYTFA